MRCGTTAFGLIQASKTPPALQPQNVHAAMSIDRISLGCPIKVDGMYGTSSAHGGDKKCVQNFFGMSKEKTPLGRLGVVRKIILKSTSGKTGWDDVL
jgi:hypothetical protein